MTDLSSLNTALIINHMKNNNFGRCDFILNATPLEYKTNRYYYQQNRIIEDIKLSRLQTGNTNPDLFINNRPYDIKHTESTSMNYNHIYPWPYEKFILKIEPYFINLERELLAKTTKEKINIKIFKDAHFKLKSILSNKNTSWEKKNDEWQSFIFEQKNLPKNFNFPLAISITSSPYKIQTPKYVSNNFHIDNSVIDNPINARRAIAGIFQFYGREAFLDEISNHGFDNENFEVD